MLEGNGLEQKELKKSTAARNKFRSPTRHLHGQVFVSAAVDIHNCTSKTMCHEKVVWDHGEYSANILQSSLQPKAYVSNFLEGS